MGWTRRTLRQKTQNDRQTAFGYLKEGGRGTTPKSASNEVSADGSGWNSTSALTAFSISTSEGSPLSGKLWRQVTSDGSVSLSNNNRIAEWEFGDRTALPSRLYPLTTNTGKANTLLSAIKQGFFFVWFSFWQWKLRSKLGEVKSHPTKKKPWINQSSSYKTHGLHLRVFFSQDNVISVVIYFGQSINYCSETPLVVISLFNTN